MKKLSEILNEANQSSVIVETVDASDKPNPFTIKYMELLEGFGVKSITELDGDRFEEFHAKAMQAIKEDNGLDANRTRDGGGERWITVHESRIRPADRLIAQRKQEGGGDPHKDLYIRTESKPYKFAQGRGFVSKYGADAITFPDLTAAKKELAYLVTSSIDDDWAIFNGKGVLITREY